MLWAFEWLSLSHLLVKSHVPLSKLLICLDKYNFDMIFVWLYKDLRKDAWNWVKFLNLLCGRRRGWDDLGEWHWNMYNIIYGTSRQSRFDARYWMLGAGALGRPRGMVWGGRREEGSGWGTHVYLWQIHFDIWQNQYNIVNLNKIKFKKIK